MKKEEAKAATEEAKPVTAKLTYIKSGKGGKQTKEVPYLAEGRKIATMETSKGVVTIELWDDKAPNTVVNFVSLANSGRYDGVEFHRVIDGFMAQTGDVENKKGTGGPGYSIPAEFHADLSHVRGVVSMARSSDPDSGGSQFFIVLASATHLDGKYAAFGKVIEGMDIIDSLQKGDGANGAVSKPDKIVKLTVESVPVVESVPAESVPEK
ncbi:MAG: peptidylprolyl isomerase [Candidatus Eisenbacteria sp.]|nr:peptidylprolyl isomerase [Candidatus Eisenbacteria bacterium]